MKLKVLVTALLGLLAAYAQHALAAQITPIELLRRPLLKGPQITSVLSNAGQFAGRTLLASGSATQVVSTSAVVSGNIFNLSLEAALPATYTTQGRVAINSGLSIGTASTTAVYSGQVIALSLESPNALTSGQALRVDSIVGGVSFAIATTNSLTTVASGAVAMWKIPQAEPVGIKVNTHASGYFILGWADGQSRPVDVNVLWETRRTS